MMNKSYRRVPSILTSATKSFSTSALKSEVQDFEGKLEKNGQIGSLKSTFESIYGLYNLWFNRLITRVQFKLTKTSIGAKRTRKQLLITSRAKMATVEAAS